MKKSKLQAVAEISYVVVNILFLLFFIYMGMSENISVQKVRESRTYHRMDYYSVKEIEDSSAPIGIRREYSWIMDDITTSDTTFAFYLVHHYAEVYFDDELMYRLMPKETNKIGKSISSNWITIPVYPEDSGRQVRVIVTPVYESVRNREIEFEIGSLHNLYSTQLKKDLPQLILSGICIIFGVLIMLLQFAYIVHKKTKSWKMFYWGNFLLLLGIWRITDTRFSPWIFPDNTMLLGYLSIGAMLLAGIPFMLFLKESFSGRRTTPILIDSLTISGVALALLLCQIFGIADFRELIIFNHIVIAAMIVLLIVILILENLRKKKIQIKMLARVFLLISGVLADAIIYYVNRSSAGILFSVLAVFLYTLLLFGENILDINKKAYVDIHTGLYNKNRWNDLIDRTDLQNEHVGMMMLDINHLKYINDTFGHESGDKVIFAFANILRGIILSPNAICRWGGDEFAVILKDTTSEIVEGYLKEIRHAVDEYNERNGEPELQYAAGYALSSEFPEMSWELLLEKADERMYLDKKQWYLERSVDSNTGSGN